MKDKWHIWEQRGETITHVAEGSVRLGRTLRAARKHDLTTAARVFVAKRKLFNEAPAIAPRYHARTTTHQIAQAEVRAKKLASVAAERKFFLDAPVPDELVDQYYRPRT